MPGQLPKPSATVGTYRSTLLRTAVVADLIGDALALETTTGERRRQLLALRARADALRQHLLPNQTAACHRAAQELSAMIAFVVADPYRSRPPGI